MYPVTGYYRTLESGDGGIWNILDGEVAHELTHNSSLLGRRVRIEGRMYRKAGAIEVGSYQPL